MAKGRLTIKDVAHIAGVGVGTVSRVLNNHKSVDPTVRAHVREAIRTLNYEPDTRARDLPRGPTSTVAIVVRDRTMKYLVDFVRAVQEVLDDDGYSMTMAFSESKELAIERLEEMSACKITMPFVDERLQKDRVLMGQDFWSYGIDKNKHVLNSFFAAHHAQGLSKRVVAIDEMFHESMLESFRI